MNDTATLRIPGAHCPPTPSAASAWNRALYPTVADAEPVIRDLLSEGCECRLVVLAPDVYVVEWRRA